MSVCSSQLNSSWMSIPKPDEDQSNAPLDLQQYERLCRSLLAPHGWIKSGNRTNRQVSFIDIDAVPQVLFLGDKADYCKAIPRAG